MKCRRKEPHDYEERELWQKYLFGSESVLVKNGLRLRNVVFVLLANS